MGGMRWTGWLAVTFASVALAGCGTAGQPSASSGGSSSSNGMSSTASSTPAATAASSTGVSGAPNDVLLGAAASPPMGSGNGTLLVDRVASGKVSQIPLISGANAFQVAVDGSLVYVPTLQGVTYVVSLKTNSVLHSIPTPAGARIAVLATANDLLLIAGPKSVTAYALPSLRQVWQTASGGNALSVVGTKAYLSSPAASATTVIDLKSGQAVATIPVGHIEDSVYDPQMHTLWLADWTTGDMTILNTLDNKVLAVVREQEGGGFSMSNMMGSSGGFMQLAVGPTGQHVYAASFSGNIMVYSATSNSFEKDISTNIPMAKLSGIAIDASGHYAYVTVESKKETVAVSLKTDKVVATEAGLMSNRWFVVNR